MTHRFRQVHLDFHTALECGAVGENFDPRAFAETFQMGRVDTVNIFAKCHHGYSYYPTRVGTMHPGLSFDLLGAQIEALHGVDIRCPIYVSVKWDDLAGMKHPEWVCVDREGRAVMRPPASSDWGWTTMDVSSAYADQFCAQIEELIERYGSGVDGFWLDICFPVPNYSPWGQAQMRAAGVDIADPAAVMRFTRARDLAFFARVSAVIRGRAPQATLYFNGTTDIHMAEVTPYVTHFEVESLPTSGGAWGYLHYPIVARHARTQGKEIIGMTGRFHKSWADFGGLKTRDQLDYECGAILSAGGRICVGDQLHPGGALDPAVYRLLGESFARVEALEPWLADAAPAAEVALLALGDPATTHNGVGSYSADVEGAAQALFEAGVQFDILDPSADLNRYAGVILSDGAALDEALQARLNAYLAAGGRLVVSGTGALDPQTGRFQLDAVPVMYRGKIATTPCYLRPDALLAGGPGSGANHLSSDYDYVFYDAAHLVEPKPGAQPHGEIRPALFNRTWEHFTSHQHAPVAADGGPGDAHPPVAVRGENVLYFAAPLFSAFRGHDYWAYREMAVNALRSFLPPALLLPQAPGWVEFTLHRQPASGERPRRQIIHVVAYHPRRTLQGVPHVDQCWPTAGLKCRVKLDGLPSRVYLAPDGKDMPFTISNGYATLELPPVGAHAVVAVEYGY